MNGLENQTYLVAYLISNLAALLLLVASVRKPAWARWMFVFLFAGAGAANWVMVLGNPNAYLDYADLSFSALYRSFIRGWFSHHIQGLVGTIATCQGLIAAGLMMKGWIYQLACAGAVVFLVAILPLGIGAAFPATAFMAIGAGLLLKKNPDVIWKSSRIKIEKRFHREEVQRNEPVDAADKTVD